MIIDSKHVLNDETAQNDAPLRTGQLLGKLRRDRGMCIEDIAKETNVSVATLCAIEDEDYAKLPHDAFARGLIALYGNALGEDGRQLARLFFHERDNAQGNETRSVRERARDRMICQGCCSPQQLAEPAHISSAAVAGVMLLCIVLFFVGFYVYFSWHPFSFFLNAEEKTSAQSSASFHPADPSTRQVAPGQAGGFVEIQPHLTMPPEFVLHRQKWSDPKRQQEWLAPDQKDTAKDLSRFPEMPAARPSSAREGASWEVPNNVQP